MVQGDYRNEDALKHAREAFTETIAMKLQHLRRYIKKGTNPDLTGKYIEAVVRGFIRNWIGHRLYLTGTFYSSEFEQSGETPLQIDGIVYDPHAGPAVLIESEFAVVHPAFCTSVIEVKTSCDDLKAFEQRLRLIYSRYMHHLTTPQVMGVILADADPETHSNIPRADGKTLRAYDYSTVPWCPMFILFKEQDNEYTPFMPAVDAMIRAIYRNQHSAGNYL